MNYLPDLPPPDRFGAWLDRRAERAGPRVDVYKSTCLLVSIAIFLPGLLLAGVGVIPDWLAVMGCVVGVTTGALLAHRYHPDNRQF